ncbi:MAG: class I SAM-dependent methyltransferase, partial [Chloroflexota bacterium]
MLLGQLRAIALADYPEFFRRPGAAARGWQTGGMSRPDEQAKARTAASFGYEWDAFSTMLPVYQQNFIWYTEPLGRFNWRASRVLDAGCGTGRHAYHALARGAHVVGVDLSRAIDVAAANASHVTGATADFVQADLCQLPFAAATFDLVYSLGVLHHLPDPEQGASSLSSMLKPGGQMLVYLYWNLEGEPVWRKRLLAAVNTLRHVTRRMDFATLRRFSRLFSAACYCALVVPGRIWGGRVGHSLPLSFYQAYPYRVLYNDTFDRFSAPLERRY